MYVQGTIFIQLLLINNLLPFLQEIYLRLYSKLTDKQCSCIITQLSQILNVVYVDHVETSK